MKEIDFLADLLERLDLRSRGVVAGPATDVAASEDVEDGMRDYF